MTKVQAVLRVIAGFAATFFAVALLALLLLVSRGIQARPPGKWETRILTLAKHRFLVGSRGLKNPLPATSKSITEGQQNFSHYCFACHGLDGQNTGVPFAETMSPPVPSLASREVQHYTDGQLCWIIENGLWPSGMPASHGILTDEEIWSIVIYIRNLPRGGSLGEPPAYSGEDCGAVADQSPPPHGTKQPWQSAP
jgi:S-disulfanyl-L-cysteine oxidoreductase SoxD